MFAATASPPHMSFAPADLSSTALSYVLPLGTDARGAEAAAPRRHHPRGPSAAIAAAGRSISGVLGRATPPGAIGHRTLWAMLLGLFIARILWAVLMHAIGG